MVGIERDLILTSRLTWCWDLSCLGAFLGDLAVDQLVDLGLDWGWCWCWQHWDWALEY